MTLEDALAQLNALVEPGRAAGMADYHKVPRTYLGIPNPALNDLAKAWRQSLSVDERVALADALWKTDIFEGRLAAAKLLTQARIRPDQAVWDLIVSWVPDFDSWAIADHAMMAGQKRLLADPARIEQVDEWTKSDSHWTRRAAMVITLPFTKQNHPKPVELEIRKRVLGWAVRYVQDPEWFIQKSVAWWLRDLSKHDPERVSYFLQNNAKHMKPFARKEATKYLSDDTPDTKVQDPQDQTSQDEERQSE
ncbi:DNA alkylation repair protein [Thalassovita taeanensis]|uniref:3-methyladenine DNA glycosylase AlkD n=1 Tax=Thalassovita taeanensis TaxID=657014 RepID=A0A1H9FLW4_9RHOB|nr:DNA alkylation repair protein [Thalassovita taeanensis]SEQ38912.1 3-methyladenine DNA glycosylase AlkD [Thalassovita taeanensis]